MCDEGIYYSSEKGDDSATETPRDQVGEKKKYRNRRGKRIEGV